MSMTNYQNMLKEINNKINENSLKYSSTIIIGDNSTGKSELLKLIIKNNKENYYFIDSPNRFFDITKVINEKNIDFGDYKEVVKQRLEINHFNLADSFYYPNSGRIEAFYFTCKEKIKKLLKTFLNIDFTLKKENSIANNTYEAFINNNKVDLSSGYQAIIRIFIEILYFEHFVRKNNIKNPVIVIDEVNEFLSTKNERNIMPFLLKTFPKLNFIITTHSYEVIASSLDFNLIILKENNYEILDGNDYSTVTDVREIFRKLYNYDETDVKSNIDDKLMNLFNQKIEEKWSSKSEDVLNDLLKNKKELSNSQVLLLHDIENW